jgi:hypothetical protein
MVCALRCADFFCLMHRSQDGLGWYLVREKDILVIQVKGWFVLIWTTLEMRLGTAMRTGAERKGLCCYNACVYIATG